MKKKYKINKKRVLALIGIAILLIFFLIKITSRSNYKYVIKKDNIEFNVTEENNENVKYIEISVDNKIYPTKIFNYDKNKIVTDIYYYNHNNYSCLLPILSDKVVVDMQCYKDGILYNYNAIYELDSALDKQVSKIKVYDIDKFSDNIKKKTEFNTITYYDSNEIEKTVSINTYKGIFNKKLINIFENDIYYNELSIFHKNYYVTADYNKKYDFDKFYVINLSNNEIFNIDSKYTISLDSYIQGIVDDNIYIYDKDNECQYKLNIENRKIELISTADVNYYSNGKWSKISKIKANNETFFNYETLDNDFSNYEHVLKTADSYGYYYLFELCNHEYKVYRVNMENLNIKKYLFTIPDYESFKYNSDFVYFILDNYLYYYSDSTGLRRLLKNSEFEYNSMIKYYIY